MTYSLRISSATRFAAPPIVCGLPAVLVGLISLTLMPVGLSAQQAVERPRVSGVALDSTEFVVSYTLGGHNLQKRLPIGALERIVLHTDRSYAVAPAGNSAASDGRLITKQTSRVDGHAYSVELDSTAAYISSSEAPAKIARVPEDILNLASGMWKKVFRPQSSSSYFNLDTDTGEIRVSLDQTMRIVNVLALAVLFFSGLVGWQLWRLRRDRTELTLSRRRLMSARDEERKKLAADLHDGVIQEIQYVIRTMADDDATAIGDLVMGPSDVKSVLQQVTRSLRDLCANLRPPVLAHFGLAEAVRSHTAVVKARHPAIHFDIQAGEDGRDLPDDMSLALFRILQESVNNIEKHANASLVEIELNIDERWVELIVRDDGEGFRVPRRLIEYERDGHLGLSGISQRAESIDAALEVRSNLGKGTTVRVVANRPGPTRRTPTPAREVAVTHS